MASFRLYITMYIYGMYITSATTGIQLDMLYAISETQHTFCYHSSPCYWFGNQSMHVSTLREVWKAQITLNETKCCESCSCDSYDCWKLGTCCPEYSITYEEFSKSSSLQHTFCEPLQLKSRDSFNNKRSYPTTRKAIAMITKCPVYDNSPRRKKRDYLNKMCENKDISDISTKIPVTYIPRQLTFRNKYCAECHGYVFVNLHSWNLQLVCSNSTFSLTKQLSMVDLFSKILETDECNIFFYPREYFTRIAFCNLYVSSCNMSGKWKTYHPIIDTACTTYTAPYMKKYKNIFCYMCNADEADGDDCLTDYTFDDTLVTFSMLLRDDRFLENDDFINEDKSNRCPINAIFDKLQKFCLHIICLSPKIYLDGSCANLASAVGGVGYKVFLHLKQRYSSKNDVTGYAIEAYFGIWIDVIGLTEFINTTSIYFERSDTKSSSSNVFGFYFEFYLPAEYPQNVTLIDSIHDLHDTVVEMNINSANETREFHVRLEHVNICKDLDSGMCISTFDNITANRFVLLNSKTYEISDIIISGFEKDRLVFLLPTYNCPMVTLDSHFYAIRHSHFGVKLETLSIILSKAEYMEKEGSFDINVCKHTFNMIQEKAIGDGVNSNMHYPYSMRHFLIQYQVFFMFFSATYIQIY